MDAISKYHKDGVEYNEIGVLFRTRDVARQIEQVCTVRGIPFRSLSGILFSIKPTQGLCTIMTCIHVVWQW